MPSTESPRLRLFVEDAEAIDSLFQQALDKHGQRGLVELLDFAHRFRRFSLFNSLLLWSQRRGAVMVGSRAQWRKIGREVLPDATPVVILQPFGPIAFVYELEDTEGTPVPGQSADPFLAFGRVKPTTWARTVTSARNCGVVTEVISNYGSGLAGTAAVLHHDPRRGATVRTEDPTVRWRVKVNGRLPPAAQFATLAHELGHVYCGHLGADERQRWPDRSHALTEKQRELEAEAVSWLVCRRGGLETRSADYLAGYVTTEAARGISVYAVHVAAHRIEARGDPEPRAVEGSRPLAR